MGLKRSTLPQDEFFTNVGLRMLDLVINESLAHSEAIWILSLFRTLKHDKNHTEAQVYTLRKAFKKLGIDLDECDLRNYPGFGHGQDKIDEIS